MVARTGSATLTSTGGLFASMQKLASALLAGIGSLTIKQS
jgi:hypothetical protein